MLLFSTLDDIFWGNLRLFLLISGSSLEIKHATLCPQIPKLMWRISHTPRLLANMLKSAHIRLLEPGIYISFQLYQEWCCVCWWLELGHVWWEYWYHRKWQTLRIGASFLGQPSVQHLAAHHWPLQFALWWEWGCRAHMSQSPFLRTHHWLSSSLSPLHLPSHLPVCVNFQVKCTRTLIRNSSQICCGRHQIPTSTHCNFIGMSVSLASGILKAP